MSRRLVFRFALAFCSLATVFPERIHGQATKPSAPDAPKAIVEPPKEAIPVPPLGAGSAMGKFYTDLEATLKTSFDAARPIPLPPIPDDPPPHEGALIDEPYIIEPPDLIIVEVLEALPGRPISGERLVRPDGKISLGFYGEFNVRGLTCDQVKVKVIQQLRQFLPDEVLGLVEDEDTPEPAGELDPNAPSPPAMKEEKAPAGAKPTSRYKRRSGITKKPIRQAALRIDDDEKPPPTTNLSIPAGGNVTIKIEIQQGEPTKTEPPQTPFDLGEPGMVSKQVIAPEDSNRVFVDVVAYNSKFYYVLGDVAKPGKMPFTGHETVLDALQYAGGLINSGSADEIGLVRPARGGKPGKFYKIDLKAITEKGDKRLNYQLFPGDRLIVGRREILNTTYDANRLSNAIGALAQLVLQSSALSKALIQSAPDMSPEQQQALIRDWFQFAWKGAKPPGTPDADEAVFHELLRRQIRPLPPSTEPAKEKK